MLDELHVATWAMIDTHFHSNFDANVGHHNASDYPNLNHMIGKTLVQNLALFVVQEQFLPSSYRMVPLNKKKY